MRKRLISLLLVFSMVISFIPAAAASKSVKDMSNDEKKELLKNPFTDVEETDWYYDAVQYVRINSIFNGITTTTFDPDGTMTRGMFVTVLGRMAGVDTSAYEGETAFSDVPVNAYYAPYVAWASKHGITQGTGDGKFSPAALINRQQMAAFFVRYFETFDVTYETGEHISTTPADLDQVAEWAKEAVLTLWERGLLNGDGVNFDPTGSATRAQTATLCMRADEVVETWYKEPGIPSERVRIDPADLEVKEEIYCVVRFYDGKRRIDSFVVPAGCALQEMPAVEDYSKEGYVLVGYYRDAKFTRPFYPDEPIYMDTNVYAQYQEMEREEALTVTTYTQMDMSPDLSFAVQSLDGTPVSSATVTLETKDGSEPVSLAFVSDGNGVTTVSAVGGFNPGCSYELHLADGLVFSGKEETIRTATFSIFREEEEKLKLNDDVVYIPAAEACMVGDDTVGGTLSYGGSLAYGDIVCIYTGIDPRERTAVSTDNDAALLDPAVYVQITSNNGNGTYRFAPLDEEDQLTLYELPDNFPLLVAEGEIGSGTANISSLDVSMYENMMGSTLGTLSVALTKVNVGDFVTLYSGELQLDAAGNATNITYGRITGYDSAVGTITYVASSEQEILDSMNLYANVQLDGTDLVTDAEAAAFEAAAQAQLENSDFAAEAAAVLMDMAVETYALSSISDEGIATFGARTFSSRAGTPNVGGFSVENVSIGVELIRSGEKLHFNGGVQMRVTLSADFSVPDDIAVTTDECTSIKLNASFIEEVTISPGVQGALTYTKILGIPVPNGVKVNAHVDVKNYTDFEFDAELYTGSVSQGKIAASLEDVMDIAEREGLSDEYEAALQELMNDYSDMVTKETDWVRLVEKDIFSAKMCVYGITLGIETEFVVRADMSLAIGSSLEYEVGKRYNFWFKIGLYSPTAGSSTMDLIDERFAFQFYVMGRLGVRAGVKATIYAGIGVASVGITAEMGPYVKLWGFYIYEYDKLRPANSNVATVSSRMVGGLTMEFGLYFTLGFEAQALRLFEYSYDFLDEEIPLLTAGEEKYYYDILGPETDEVIRVVDENGDSSDGYNMEVPNQARLMKYVNLKTGVQAVGAAPSDHFIVTFSSPYFTYDAATQMITVNVPEHVNVLTADMTLTYVRGKQAFTDYDMTVTVPLMWTNLADSELKEYKTVSVTVTDGTDYETVWSKKVLKGELFNLPSAEDVKVLINWSDLKYDAAASTGYGAQQTTDLTVTDNEVYEFRVTYKKYSITVNGIQGSAPRTYYARYGEAFDFSKLEGTGTNNYRTGTFTIFTHVTTGMTAPTAVEWSGTEGKYVMAYETIDLTKPITGKVAEALYHGGTATAHYQDNSVTAVFSFRGINREELRLTLRKGDNVAYYAAAVDAAVAAAGTEITAVRSVEPALGPIDQSTNYTAYCVELTGQRALVSFDVQDACEVCRNCRVVTPEPMDKLVGSLIFNLPTVTRRGYTFDGWFVKTEIATDTGVSTDSDAGDGSVAPPVVIQVVYEPATSKTVPETGITLYAQWTPITVGVEFKTMGGTVTNGVATTRTVTYDSTYGKVAGTDGDTAFPVLTREGYVFLGWYDAKDEDETRDATAANKVTVDTPVIDIEKITLYAHWRKLIDIETIGVVTLGTKTWTYDGGAAPAANVSVSGISIPLQDGTYYSFSWDDFTVKYKNQDGESEWQIVPTDNKPGTYDVRITRAADQYFKAFELRGIGVYRINKGNRNYNGLKLTISNAKGKPDSYMQFNATVDTSKLGGAKVTIKCSWECKDSNCNGSTECNNGDLIKITGRSEGVHPDFIEKYWLSVYVHGDDYWNDSGWLQIGGTFKFHPSTGKGQIDNGDYYYKP